MRAPIKLTCHWWRQPCIRLQCIWEHLTSSLDWNRVTYCDNNPTNRKLGEMIRIAQKIRKASSKSKILEDKSNDRHRVISGNVFLHQCTGYVGIPNIYLDLPITPMMTQANVPYPTGSPRANRFELFNSLYWVYLCKRLQDYNSHSYEVIAAYIHMMKVHLTHWGRDKMAAISQSTLPSAFSWKKKSELRLKFHWSLFLRVQLTIFQHCFR